MSITTPKLPAARGLAALAAVAALAALPASASAHGGGRRADTRHVTKAPSRVTDRATRAVKAIARASDAVDDGDATKASAALKAARTNLASALKTATKHVQAGDAYGPASADVVLRAEHRVAAGAADLFDGQDGTVVDDLATTLKAADDGRDALVAAIGGLAADREAEYADALDSASEDVADELSDLADALSDDTLTDAAKSALTAAQTQVTATRTAIEALVGIASSSSGDDVDASTGDDGPRGDCPGGRGGRGGTSSSSNSGSGSGTGTGSGSGYLND
ncbi:MAG TPA: hypothetical protein VFG42_26990 [Baekduia sp.]|uniref:hypothetical protein n=1 Tax=Baekduia sp. TaxID=2600305 RepID=UPI002D769C31|nr:hypothetical protein [Baekduia sp.]HET6510471.1 hypothetical protein [Baekduia sp.]